MVSQKPMAAEVGEDNTVVNWGRWRGAAGGEAESFVGGVVEAGSNCRDVGELRPAKIGATAKIVRHAPIGRD